MQKFSRPPFPQDWVTVLKRSKLVRRLDLRAKQRVRLHNNVLETLCTYRLEVTLLPALRVFEWYPPDGRSATQLPLLLSLVGDQLTAIAIVVVDQREAAEKIMQGTMAILSGRTRHCQSFQLNFAHMSDAPPVLPPTSSALSSLVSAMSSLTFFACPNVPLNPDAITSLARLRLRYVSLRLPDNTTWPHNFHQTSGIDPFPTLTDITLYTTVEAYVAFSHAMALPTICSLDLRIVGEPPSNLISELFRSIRRQFSLDALEELWIYPSGTPTRESALRCATVVRSEDLRPLLDFPLVKHFNLHLPCHFALDDAIILDMAKAWPGLHELNLAEDEYCVHASLPSLTALAHLAAYSHHLDKFGLTVDARDWTGNIEAEEDERVHSAGPHPRYYGDIHPVRRPSTSQVFLWDVGTSPISDSEHVALFLATIFPMLERVRFPTESGDDEIGRAHV